VKILTAALLGVVFPVAACLAQDPAGDNAGVSPKQTVQLDAPENWSGETIALPPGFARDMTIKGVEVIRFAPGMFDPQSESFFSYALVFWLPETEPLDQKRLHDEFLKYYRGLAKAVARGRQLAVEPQDFKLKLTSFEKKRQTYRAELEWAEPFRTGQAQTLRFAITSMKSAEHKGLLLSIAASPQAHEHAIWKQLDTILKSAKFVTAGEAKPASE
jgi:hypothetical protein